MKQWMPFAALGLLLILVGGVWASGQLSLTGQARGVRVSKIVHTVDQVSPDEACPKGKSLLQAKRCPEGQTLECDNDEAPHCCSCEDAPTITCANALCQAGHSCEMDCDDQVVCLPDVCGGIAAIACPRGSECVITRTHPDAAGSCELLDCDDPPELTCANVLCTEKEPICIMNCDDEPECIAQKQCGGFAGLQCDDGDVCVLDETVPDAMGYCVPDPEDCEGEECGECVSNSDCKRGERCTASEDCMASCDCPTCTVCAGECVAAED